MVVAQQMQHRVDDQIAQLAFFAVSKFLRLLLHALHGDDHIAQRQKACRGVEEILVVLRRRLAGDKFKLREAQNIGGAVDLAHIEVDLVDARVTREQDIDLAGAFPLRRFLWWLQQLYLIHQLLLEMLE